MQISRDPPQMFSHLQPYCYWLYVACPTALPVPSVEILTRITFPLLQALYGKRATNRASASCVITQGCCCVRRKKGARMHFEWWSDSLNMALFGLLTTLTVVGSLMASPMIFTLWTLRTFIMTFPFLLPIPMICIPIVQHYQASQVLRQVPITYYSNSATFF